MLGMKSVFVFVQPVGTGLVPWPLVQVFSASSTTCFRHICMPWWQ
jgi:hypothetical protein